MSARKILLLLAASIFLAVWGAAPTAAAVKNMARSPYLGAIVVDAATGRCSSNATPIPEDTPRASPSS